MRSFWIIQVGPKSGETRPLQREATGELATSSTAGTEGCGQGPGEAGSGSEPWDLWRESGPPMTDFSLASRTVIKRISVGLSCTA